LRNFLPMQPGDVLRTCASIDAIASLSGFSPQTEVEVGVARFVAWYRDFYHRHEAPAEAELVS
jgi:UDP-glucuronate 4-epimerase